MAVLESSQGVDSSYQSQAARAAHVIDNVVPPYKGEKRVVFLTILALAQMGIWVT